MPQDCSVSASVPRASRKLTWLMFAGTFLTYLAFSPLDILEMGYVRRFFAVGSEMVNHLRHLFGCGGELQPVGTTAHGLIEPIIDIPFIWIGRLLGGPYDGRNGGPDIVLSLEPILEVALICAIVFLWIRKLSTPTWAYLLTLAAAFTTMLWAYAYISLETTQSLFLILAGYLVLAHERQGRWKTAAVALCCALACSVKSAGLFLIPAVGYLIFSYARKGRGVSWGKLIPTVLTCVAVFAANRHEEMQSGAYTVQWHGSIGFFAVSHTTPVAAVLNVISLFLSLNKGLLIYCPILVLSLAGLGRAWRRDRRVVIFSMLCLAGIVSGVAPLFSWADECWGPRYLCAAVAPLVVCLGAARSTEPFKLRREWALILLMAWGLCVSSLGGLFHYRTLHMAAIGAQPVTLEDLLYQTEWNPIRFDTQLLKLWLEKELLHRSDDETWPPLGRPWPAQERVPLVTPVRLSEYAAPQGFVFSARKHWSTWRDRIAWIVCFLSLPAGVALLIRAGLIVAKQGEFHASRQVVEMPVAG